MGGKLGPTWWAPWGLKPPVLLMLGPTRAASVLELIVTGPAQPQDSTHRGPAPDTGHLSL